MCLILLLNLRVDAAFAGGLVELPLGHLEEVGCLPEPHLSAANHVDGVLEGLVLGEFAPVDGDPLVLKAGLYRACNKKEGNKGRRCQTGKGRPTPGDARRLLG